MSTLDTEDGNDLAEAEKHLCELDDLLVSLARRRAVREFVEAVRDDHEIRSNTPAKATVPEDLALAITALRAELTRDIRKEPLATPTVTL